MILGFSPERKSILLKNRIVVFSTLKKALAKCPTCSEWTLVPIEINATLKHLPPMHVNKDHLRERLLTFSKNKC